MTNVIKKFREKQRKLENEWYNLRPILGNANWALFYVLLGGREAGKSYSVTNFFVDQWKNKGIPFTWLRLTETQARKLLQNNAEKLVDSDLRRKYNLDLVTSGNNVYEVKREQKEVKHKDGTTEMKSVIVEKKLMARVYAISTFYTDKGSIFDKDFLNDLSMRYNIAIDEFEREKGEKNTFDILYSLVNQLESNLRSTVKRTKIFFLGNTLEEASDILCAFNFIPEEWGTYRLVRHKKKLVELLKNMDNPNENVKKQARQEYGQLLEKDANYFGKRCVIQNIEPSEAYKTRRKGTIADILLPTASTFTNKIETDTTLITKKRLVEPSYIVKFTKSKDTWFTIWDGNVVKKYNGEKKTVIAMRPYLDEVFNTDLQKNMITLFDTRSMVFTNLITFKEYQKQIELLKPRK